jgi:hypothetical protein
MTTGMPSGRRAAAGLLAGFAILLALAWAAGDVHGRPLHDELQAMLRQAPPGANVISPTRVEWPRQGVTVLLHPTMRDWNGCNGAWVCRHNVAAGKHNLPSSINDSSSYLQLF